MIAVCDGARMQEPDKLPPRDLGNRSGNGWRAMASTCFRDKSRERTAQSLSTRLFDAPWVKHNRNN